MLSTGSHLILVPSPCLCSCLSVLFLVFCENLKNSQCGGESPGLFAPALSPECDSRASHVPGLRTEATETRGNLSVEAWRVRSCDSECEESPLPSQPGPKPAALQT